MSILTTTEDNVFTVMNRMKYTDPLTPSASLLCKLASVAVHADEMLSPKGHDFDRHALQSAINDPEVSHWISEMTKMGMAPVKR